MSTRCVINFCENGEVVAKIYRHYDGYPSTKSSSKKGVDTDLEIFFDEVCSECRDTRFYDAAFLAARFIVWQAQENNFSILGRILGKLNFSGIGVLMKDPGDIEYRWFVDCDNDAKFITNRPQVRYEVVS